jgi:hypothetical protein
MPDFFPGFVEDFLLMVFSHLTSSSIILISRCLSFSCAFIFENLGWLDGSSTIWANITARAAATAAEPTINCKVEG